MKLCFILLGLFFLLSCQNPGKVSREKLIDYLQNPNNGLTRRIETENGTIEAIYRAKDLIILQDIQGGGINQQDLDSLRARYKRFEYFLLRFSSNGQALTHRFIGHSVEYRRINEYLSFEIGKDIFLIHEGDTLSVEDFAFISTYESRSSDVLVAFRLGDGSISSNLKLSIDENVLGMGRCDFEFYLSDIRKTPGLDFNSNSDENL